MECLKLIIVSLGVKLKGLHRWLDVKFKMVLKGKRRRGMMRSYTTAFILAKVPNPKRLGFATEKKATRDGARAGKNTIVLLSTWNK